MLSINFQTCLVWAERISHGCLSSGFIELPKVVNTHEMYKGHLREAKVRVARKQKDDGALVDDLRGVLADDELRDAGFHFPVAQMCQKLRRQEKTKKYSVWKK